MERYEVVLIDGSWIFEKDFAIKFDTEAKLMLRYNERKSKNRKCRKN